MFYLVVYTFEAVVRILAMGLVFGRGTYLRDPLNVLDLAIVVTAYIDHLFVGTDCALSSGNNSSLTIVLCLLGSFKAARPMKVTNLCQSISYIGHMFSSS